MLKKFILPGIFFFVLLNTAYSEDRVLVLQDPVLRGPDVIYLQKYLLSQGYDLGIWGADGVFGRATSNALLQWQRDEGMEPDGRILFSQIPQIQEPEFQLSEPLAAEPAAFQNPLDEQIKAGEVLRTLYGEWDIPPQNQENGEKYLNFKLSPSGRFVAAYFYSPYGDPFSGYPLCIYDLLTEEMTVFYGFDLMGLDYDELVDSGWHSGFSDFYWTFNEDLYFLFSAGEPDGFGWVSDHLISIY